MGARARCTNKQRKADALTLSSRVSCFGHKYTRVVYYRFLRIEHILSLSLQFIHSGKYDEIKKCVDAYKALAVMLTGNKSDKHCVHKTQLTRVRHLSWNHHSWNKLGKYIEPKNTTNKRHISHVNLLAHRHTRRSMVSRQGYIQYSDCNEPSRRFSLKSFSVQIEGVEAYFQVPSSGSRGYRNIQFGYDFGP